MIFHLDQHTTFLTEEVAAIEVTPACNSFLVRPVRLTVTLRGGHNLVRSWRNPYAPTPELRALAAIDPDAVCERQDMQADTDLAEATILRHQIEALL